MINYHTFNVITLRFFIKFTQLTQWSKMIESDVMTFSFAQRNESTFQPKCREES